MRRGPTINEPLAWQRRAACTRPGVDPERFFPDKGGSTAAAKWICRRVCPVREACLAYALEHRIEDGIWGGLSPLEREPLLPKVVKSRAPKRPRPTAAFRSPLVDCPCGAETCRGKVAKATRNDHLRRKRAEAAA